METHLEPAAARTGVTVLGREQTSLVSTELSLLEFWKARGRLLSD